MYNINLKALIFEPKAAKLCGLDEFLNKAKEFGVKTCIDLKDEVDAETKAKFQYADDFDFATICDKIRMPIFHCVVFAVSDEYIKAAIDAEFKVVRIGGEAVPGLFAMAESLPEIDVKTFLECGRTKPYEVCETAFIERDIDPTDTKHLESIFALGNGYLGLRGTYDERDEALSSECGMYVNEIFESFPIKHLVYFKGFAKNDQHTINLCDWRITELFIDGEKAVSTKLINHKRVLNIIDGRIEREFEFETQAGKRAKVTSTRIVNMARPHSAEIRYTVEPLNFDGKVEIKSTIVKHTIIHGFNPTKTVSEEATSDGLTLVISTERSKRSVGCCVEHKMLADSYTSEFTNEGNEYSLTYAVDAKQGSPVTLEKYAAFYSTADGELDYAKCAKEEASSNCELGFDALEKEQSEFWAKHWENGDIVVEGNSLDQQTVRFGLFHLRQQLPSINNASIGATGLTGPSYSGRVFWDTEMYLEPYYLHTDAESCKGLILYRKKILDKARERAQQMGSIGALYSWCSVDGEETSVIFEASTAEYHVNCSVAYSIWRYHVATGDAQFVYENCAEMLFETSKYMAHRGAFIPAYDGRFCINAVCGPDEYGSGVNNNCYTNFMVQFQLRYALRIYDEMAKNAPELLKDVIAKTGIDETELDLWKRAADKMYYHIDEKYGVYEQDDSFLYNDPVDMEMTPMNVDLRMINHPLDLWRMQVIKQADVVLLMFILGNLFTKEEKKINYDFYEPKTNHGSSLSATIHSIMANEIGYEEDAYEYFRSTALMDIGDFKKNTAGGLHIACIGGVWMTVVNGFLGMRMYDSGVEFNTKLPKAWTKLTCRFAYQNALIEICATQTETTYTLVEGEKMSFKVCDEDVQVTKENPAITIENK